MTNGPFEMRDEEGGYVEFLNEEVPTVVREIDGRVAILTTLEQPRKVVGYRVYDPGFSPSEVFGSASPAGVGVETPPPSSHVRVYPYELTDDLRFILSMMMWTTGPMAHALRDGGQDIKRKAEDEQAEVMHWLIGLALEHGPAWRDKASDRIREIRAALATTEGSAP